VTTSVTLAYLQLEWDQEYLEYPDTNQWAHHDVASAADGRIVTGHPDGRSLLVYGPDGRHLDTVETQSIELHGIANDAAREDSFWIADPGEKCTPGEPEYDEFVRPGRVLNVSLSAREVVGEGGVGLSGHGDAPPGSRAARARTVCRGAATMRSPATVSPMLSIIQNSGKARSSAPRRTS